ncbi:MAG: replication initiation protein [Streptococcus parauberis]
MVCLGKEIVCYKNEMNNIPLRNFNAKEMDLLFSICSRVREKGTDFIEFTFDDLKVLSDYKMTATKHFIKDIESVYDKLLQLNFKMGTDTEFTKFVLFKKYTVSASKEIVTIGVNEEFKYILNEITQNFTKFELEEFTSIRSSYAKTAYRQLKRFRKTGYAIFTIEQFRELFCVPESYQMYNINQKIIKPIESELSQYFNGLKIKKIKAKGGRTITHIEFTFQGEDDMLPNGKYRIKKGKEFIEKDPTEMSEDEVKKVFPDLPKTLSEKLAEDEDLARELEEFLIQRSKMRNKNKKGEADSKVEGQFEFDI